MDGPNFKIERIYLFWFRIRAYQCAPYPKLARVPWEISVFLRKTNQIWNFDHFSIFRPKSHIWSDFLKNTPSLKGSSQDLKESVIVFWARIHLQHASYFPIISAASATAAVVCDGLNVVTRFAKSIPHKKCSRRTVLLLTWPPDHHSF